MGPKEKDKDSDKPDESVLSREVSEWYARQHGYTRDDAAKETDTTRQDVDDAYEVASQQDEDTN